MTLELRIFGGGVRNFPNVVTVKMVAKNNSINVIYRDDNGKLAGDELVASEVVYLEVAD